MATKQAFGYLINWVVDEFMPEPIDVVIAAEEHWLAIPSKRRPVGFTAVLVGVGLSWTGAVVGYTPKDGRRCPACGDRPGGYCLVCSASPDDPLRWPMMTPKDRSAILAGPPLGKQVAKFHSRRQRRSPTRCA